VDVGEDLVPEPADEAEETRQGEPASHRKRELGQRDLAEYERELARRVSRSNGPTATGGRQSLGILRVTNPLPCHRQPSVPYLHVCWRQNCRETRYDICMARAGLSEIRGLFRLVGSFSNRSPRRLVFKTGLCRVGRKLHLLVRFIIVRRASMAAAGC